MNRQEYYDLLVATSAAGGFPSIDDDPNNRMCLYRGPDGRKCAFGLILPDDEHTPDLEGRSVDILVANGRIGTDRPWWVDGMTAKDMYLTQEAHDSTAFKSADKPGSWDHALFVSKLDALKCFKDVVKAAPAA